MAGLTANASDSALIAGYDIAVCSAARKPEDPKVLMWNKGKFCYFLDPISDNINQINFVAH